ncbi:MAG: multifunctional oxoglutarate decarboxylase/oxoglutarate dehydrogenase thiamine pyrophosphate-binding subunit/dihydrolipoyllysine-residue succinyltransferase subunit, partial [Actinobacteria bacterium]|nr:multifunctional oxoglutarate decarboxylase/oxoglutarate dehydrogenase thiamine pyrophosphate-binding subunit/dihydrolipoyllysine-residue succinyltransferase subunit [Actinomycetota bacterium]
MSGNFGTNDWLVEEMYEKFLSDPNSVEPSWRDFFRSADFKAADFSASATGQGIQGARPIVGAPRGGTPPIPKAKVPLPPINQPVDLVVNPAKATQTTSVNENPKSNENLNVSTGREENSQASAPIDFIPQQTLSQPKSDLAPLPADPISQPVKTIQTPAAAKVEPIRGVGARVVASMEASLAVPTATSVRAIPAKLLIDNRTVVNNHLKRARGGKVSFTHLIGY